MPSRTWRDGKQRDGRLKQPAVRWQHCYRGATPKTLAGTSHSCGNTVSSGVPRLSDIPFRSPLLYASRHAVVHLVRWCVSKIGVLTARLPRHLASFSSQQGRTSYVRSIANPGDSNHQTYHYMETIKGGILIIKAFSVRKVRARRELYRAAVTSHPCNTASMQTQHRLECKTSFTELLFARAPRVIGGGSDKGG